MKSRFAQGLISLSAVLFLVCLMPGNAEAGANRWHSLGPDGANVSTLVVNPDDPSELYAGSMLDVFHTNDGGLTWHRRSRGLEGLVLQLLIDPQQPNRLLAWTQQGWKRKLFVTETSGVDWRPIELGSEDLFGPVFASSEDFVVFIPYLPGVMLTSTDRGETWAESELPPEAFLETVDPDDPSRFLVRIEDDYALTEDGGNSWQACGETPSTNLRNASFDPHNRERIFITAYSDGLIVTEDGCRTWSVLNGPENESVMSIAFDPHRPDTLYTSTYEQLYRSTDRGLTWAEFGMPETWVWVGAMAFPEGDQEMMYLAAIGDDEKRGVMFSGDGGASWQLRMGGFRAQRAWNLLIHPENPDHLIAGIHQRVTYGGDGLYRSVDRGVSWTFIDGTEGFGPMVARGPSAPEILYSLRYPMSREGVIVRSTDAGVSWTEMGQAPNDTWLRAIKVDPFDPETIFTTDDYFEDAFRSDDGGRSWTQLEIVLGSDQQNIASLMPDPHREDVIYAGLWEGGVARSFDGGQSWQDGRQGIETNGVCDFYHCGDHWTIWDVIIDPVDPSRVFGLSTIGPFRSTDAGETWQLVREGLNVCCDLDPSSYEEGCSKNQGPSKLSTSFPPSCSGSPDALAFDPMDSNVVYLTADGATYRSDDGGVTWRRLDLGVWGPVVEDLHVVEGGVLLGASWLDGVVQFDIGEISASRPLPDAPIQ